jgi:DNA-binding Lrp family transcriptional regulator
MTEFARINFAESKIPVFKENKAKNYITYGTDNKYPQMLIDLYNSSPKHGALVSQKAQYIAGDKTEVIANNTEQLTIANDRLASINSYESFDDVKSKIAADLELFDGFALEIIWNKAKTSIAEIYHLPFQNVRISLDGHYWYAEDWSDRKLDPIYYYCWNPITRENKQLYYFKMYKAGQGEYPTAPYQSALKYIEIDTEIANFHLNSIKSGFSAQTLLQLFKGVPTPEEMRQTIKRFKENFSGTDNAGSIIIQFNDPNETPSVVNNLAPSDFDKQFDLLNQTVQQEILMAHRVTSPMLFGIKTEGQLGGRSELIEAYEAFQTAYIEPRQNHMDRALTSIFKFIVPVTLKTKNKPPIGLDYIQLFEKGIISQAEARRELGMSDTVAMSSYPSSNPPSHPSCSHNPFGWDDDKDLAVFEQFGELASKFEKVPFDFASALELIILQFLNGNTELTLQDLANNIKQDAEKVAEAVTKLINDGLITSADNILNVTEQGTKTLVDSGLGTELLVRYTYEKGPGISGSEIIPTSRDFCRSLIALNRVYTREDIDTISSRVGYNAWERRGGWMTVKGSSPAIHVPYCRHIWKSQLLRRKING